MNKKFLLIFGLILTISLTNVPAFAGGALPGFTSAEPPVVGKVCDTDDVISGVGPAENMTIIVTYKNEKGEVTAEATTGVNGIFSVDVEGKLLPTSTVKAKTVGLRTSECIADSNEVEITVLPARISFKNLKVGSRKITVKTYAKAKVRLQINKFAKTLKKDKKGKAVLKLPKKNRIKKGSKIKWTITYKGVKGLTYIKKIH